MLKTGFKPLVIFLLLAMSGCSLLEWNANFASDLVPQTDPYNQILVNEARALFFERQPDFSAEEWEKGPCLGYVNTDWVADVVHQPMGETDWDLANQCAQYYDGTAKHYILLDFDGEVVESK